MHIKDKNMSDMTTRAGSGMMFASKCNDKLSRSFQESLGGLGDSTTKAIVSQLEQAGISVSSEDLDIKEVEEILREYFGDGAEALMQDMFRRYATRVMLGLHGSESIEKLLPVEKVQRFLEQDQLKSS